MIRRFLLLLAVTAACCCAEDRFVIIVQKSNGLSHISAAQLRRMIMAETTTWPGGRVNVLMGPVGDPARAAALKAICGMNEGDFARFVLQLQFSGDGKMPPKVMPNAGAVRQLVQLTPGAIGIIAPSDVSDSVKVLALE